MLIFLFRQNLNSFKNALNKVFEKISSLLCGRMNRDFKYVKIIKIKNSLEGSIDLS